MEDEEDYGKAQLRQAILEARERREWKQREEKEAREKWFSQLREEGQGYCSVEHSLIQIATALREISFWLHYNARSKRD